MQGSGVHGTVVASDKKTPVAGVAVVVVPSGVQIDDKTPASGVVSLDDGSFRVECAAPGGACVVAVRRDGIRFEPAKQTANVMLFRTVLLMSDFTRDCDDCRFKDRMSILSHLSSLQFVFAVH